MEVVTEHFEKKDIIDNNVDNNVENNVENKINENNNNNSENEQDKNNLSKSELKRIETEKRVKRIHELMELIDKANEEIQFYQDELWDLLKTQIKLPNNKYVIILSYNCG